MQEKEVFSTFKLEKHVAIIECLSTLTTNYQSQQNMTTITQNKNCTPLS